MDIVSYIPWLHQRLDPLYEVIVNVLCYFGIWSRRKPDRRVKLTGQTVVITGGNRGFGALVVKDLVSRGARVVIGCRDTETGRKLVNEIKDRNETASLEVKHLDLASFKSVRSFAADILNQESSIDVLINNSGVVNMKGATMTKDGQETVIQVNYISHVLLTCLLLDRMKKSPDPRIVFVSSLAHHRPVNPDLKAGFEGLEPFDIYARGKIAIMMFCKRLARILSPQFRVYAVDPGMSLTDLLWDILKERKFAKSSLTQMIFRTVQDGANSIIFPVVADKSSYNPNNYFTCDGNVKRPNRRMDNDVAGQKVWKDTFAILGIPEIEGHK